MAKKGGLTAAGGQKSLFAGRPWQRVRVDLVGPLPETDKKNKWILVLVYHFLRWQDGISLPDATAPTVAAALDEGVFCYLSIPEVIHADRGAQFESELMIELYSLYGGPHTHTTPYHPQANEVVEWGNRALGDSLRILLLDRSPEEWDLLLP